MLEVLESLLDEFPFEPFEFGLRCGRKYVVARAEDAVTKNGMIHLVDGTHDCRAHCRIDDISFVEVAARPSLTGPKTDDSGEDADDRFSGT